MLKVYYRICPFPNGKSALFTDDKLELTRFCLQSFVRAFRNVKDLEMVFILDSCPDEYATMIMKEVPFKKDILVFETLGNVGSFHLQLSMASTYPGDVLLQEDDYYWLDNAGLVLSETLYFLSCLRTMNHQFVTPYDHPDYYDKEWHKGEKAKAKYALHDWQKVNSTCLTFGTKGSTIKKLLDIIKSFGVADHEMFMKIKEMGGELWAPIPTLATHMDKEFLAPNINWQEEWQKYQS